MAEAAFLLPVTVAVALLGEAAKHDVSATLILTVVFFINLSARFILVYEKHDWIYFLVGVAGGGGNDLMSMARGVYSYTSIPLIPFLEGLMPVWNVVFWGQVILLFRKVFALGWFKGPGFKQDGFAAKGWITKRIIVDIVVLVVLRVVIYHTYLDPVVPGLVYGGVILARMAIVRPRKDELLLVAILPYAFLFEGLMVTFGLYVYHNPVFLGMPLWLFLWWIFLVPLLVKELFAMIDHGLAKLEARAERKQAGTEAGPA